MEEYLIYFGGAPCGSLRMERQGLYTHFSACCGARKRTASMSADIFIGA